MMMHPLRRRHQAVLILGAVVALAACGGGGGDDDGTSVATRPAEPAATAASAAPATAAATAAGAPEASIAGSTTAAPATTPATGAPAVPEPAGDLGEVCESIPSLDELAAIVGSPLTNIDDYSSPTVEIDGETIVSQRCEVSGDGIGMAIFERYDLVSGQATIDGVRGQELAVDTTWPDLPGAVAWANGVMIEHDGLFLLATAITPDTVGVLDAPEAYEASAELLRAWIG